MQYQNGFQKITGSANKSTVSKSSESLRMLNETLPAPHHFPGASAYSHHTEKSRSFNSSVPSQPAAEPRLNCSKVPGSELGTASMFH